MLPINPQPADTGVSYSLSADLMTAAQLLREAAQEGAASAGGSDGNTDSSDGDSDSTDNSDDDSDTSSDSSGEDGYYDEDGDFIYYTSGRVSDTDYKVDFLTVRTPKNRTDSTVSAGEVVLLDNENTDSGDSTDSTDGSGSTDTAVTDTIVTDAATVQLSFRLLVNSDNAFKDVYKRQDQYNEKLEKTCVGADNGGFGRAQRLHVPIWTGKRRRRRTGRQRGCVGRVFRSGVVSLGHNAQSGHGRHRGQQHEMCIRDSRCAVRGGHRDERC